MPRKKDVKVNENHIARRKSLKKAAAKRLNISSKELEWREGKLYYKNSDKQVNNVPEVKKVGK